MSGQDRLTWLQGMVSNDVRLLDEERLALAACVLDPTGHVLSDLVIVNVPAGDPLASPLLDGSAASYLVDLPRPNVPRIRSLFDRYVIMEDVLIQDASDEIACVSVQGPRAVTVWRRLLRERAPGGSAASTALAVPADHTGSGGLDIYLLAADLPAVRSALDSAAIPVTDLATREVLRVEAGIPKYGSELDEKVIALEANLDPTHVSLTKGCYIGQEVIARIDSRGHTNRALTGLSIVSGDLPEVGENLTAAGGDANRRDAGRITSLVPESPALGRPIGLGYVRLEFRMPGTRLVAASRSTVLEVASLPFYSAGS